MIKKLVVEGIRFKKNKFVFDFKNDLPHDTVFLQYANTKSVGKTSGIKVYYGYRFNQDGAEPQQISLLRKALKNGDLISQQDKELNEMQPQRIVCFFLVK